MISSTGSGRIRAWQSVRDKARKLDKKLSESRDQHTEIIEAIASRDPARAGEAMRDHLLTLQERVDPPDIDGHSRPAGPHQGDEDHLSQGAAQNKDRKTGVFR